MEAFSLLNQIAGNKEMSSEEMNEALRKPLRTELKLLNQIAGNNEMTFEEMNEAIRKYDRTKITLLTQIASNTSSSRELEKVFGPIGDVISEINE